MTVTSATRTRRKHDAAFVETVVAAKWEGTVAELAARFEVTRGTVIGLLDRNKDRWPPKPSPKPAEVAALAETRPAAALARPPAKAELPAKVLEPSRQPLPAEPIRFAGPKGVVAAVTLRRSTQCAWPSDHELSDPGFGFCCAPTLPGRSYCPEHFDRMKGFRG